MSEVFEKVKAIIVEEMGISPDKVTMDADFREDLEADSLDLIALISAFEDAFGGQIPDEDIVNIKTVGDAVRYIESRQQE
ncbi:MAG: acyl carrier protein [Anaerolineae bacterium]|nr:acyl carrier protein [Anaerolineae bacterium]